MKPILRKVLAGVLCVAAIVLAGSAVGQNADLLTAGKNVIFAGLAGSGRVNLAAICPVPGQGANDRCVVINPVPGSDTDYDEVDLGHTDLPRAVVRRINIIYQIVNLTYEYQLQNTTGAQVPAARFQVQPYVTLESSAASLNDPACIDPNTGLACGGKAVLFVSADNRVNRSLADGERDRQHHMFSRAGSTGIGKQSLLNLGYPQATVNDIFSGPISIHLHVKGTARYVTDAFVFYELRLFVDN